MLEAQLQIYHEVFQVTAFPVESAQQKPRLGEMLHPFFEFFHLIPLSKSCRQLQLKSSCIFLVVALPDIVVSIRIRSVHDRWLDLCCML